MLSIRNYLYFEKQTDRRFTLESERTLLTIAILQNILLFYFYYIILTQKQDAQDVAYCYYGMAAYGWHYSSHAPVATAQ